MIIEDGKVLCIRNFYIGELKENTCGEIYYYFIEDDSHKEYEGIWVDSNDEASSTYFDVKEFPEHFKPLAEIRDKQIDSIFENEGDK